ncbi:MAG: nucleoside triphosphate pyrophosphatase [Dehalococcoidia bacterium]
MRVVLASASPRRRELLAALVSDFEIIPSSVDETFTGDGFVDAERLAYAKAADVFRQNPGAVVIGSDTVVYDDEHSYGKPNDEGDAFAMWKRLGGRTHTVATGVAVVSGAGELQYTEAWEVELSPLSDQQIRAYIASRRPMDKAGGYAIQDEDVPTVARLDGCYCAVMGLPLWTAKDLLEAAGVDCRSPDRTYERCRTCPSRPLQ